MRNFGSALHLVCFAFLLLTLGSITIAQEPPANVAGNWTIHSRGPDRRQILRPCKSHSKAVLSLDTTRARVSTENWKVTINQQHILFRTKTHTVLTFLRKSGRPPYGPHCPGSHHQRDLSRRAR